MFPKLLRDLQIIVQNHIVALKLLSLVSGERPETAQEFPSLQILRINLTFWGLTAFTRLDMIRPDPEGWWNRAFTPPASCVFASLSSPALFHNHLTGIKAKF